MVLAEIRLYGADGRIAIWFTPTVDFSLCPGGLVFAAGGLQAAPTVF